ncbi:MAG: hypothetical protein ACE5GN_03165 [Waddliaceae bacterium]
MKKMNVKLLLYLTLIILICDQSMLAQTNLSKKNHLGLTFGLSNYHSKDLMLSPLIYRGNNFEIDLSYLHKRKKSFHTLEISFTIGDINSNVPYHTQTGARAHIWYGYSRQITKFSLKDKTIPIFIGGLLKFFAEGAIPQDFENSTWILVHSLNINLGTQYPINPRHSLYWDLHFPALSYVIRPPYAGFDEEVRENHGLKNLVTNGEFHAVYDYLMLFTRFVYIYKLTEKFDLKAKYQFSYHQYDQPREVKMFTNLFSAGLTFKF